ncbi:potassium channel family protein [Crocosphaera sp. XPORK-15E]|uniref:potassium channel family protein n=1 Tax=Crocosphaera sp. XPORK-15E TaxID=3110247 RepID=UPI002B1F9A00|nr:NAD-binding protein [Crocosphaera sp. XPORK-15E]MEA5536715.1 NAD-binding protein [Crocosphaera sp. XPORK-15E]
MIQPIIEDHFLVCGLGSLGQHCVLSLKEFGVKVIAIELIEPSSWEIPQIPELLDDLIIADCRQNRVLKQAQIEQCRAALLVTTNEQVNIETALAIRQLNPKTRLIVRSAKDNLNTLLEEQLGNFIAYEPTQLPASAFAIAALGTEIRGFFTLDGKRLRVIERHLKPKDNWCYFRHLHELNSRTRRLLSYQEGTQKFSGSFHQWNPETILQPGDIVTYIESADTLTMQSEITAVMSAQTSPITQNWRNKIKRSLSRLWKKGRQYIRLVALISGGIVLLLLFIGTILIHNYYRESTFLSAFLATMILLLGGYSDLFGELREIDDIPAWLQLFSLGLTLAGTAFVGVLYALLTEALLSAKFQFTQHRLPIPQQNHIVIVGMGRVGKQVAILLQEFKQTFLGITFKLDNNDSGILSQMPLIIGNLQDVLPQANLATAKSIVVVTDDEILNLEVALMAKKLNPHTYVIVRTAGQQLGQHLMQILPQAQIIGAYGVAAEVFAGAAFGENILTIFRLDNQTILVTEYQIEAGDTLNGLLLAEVAYGYGVIPILHQKPPNSSNLMPYDDINLSVGDRLIVLATIDGLRCIEQGRLAIKPKQWHIYVEKAANEDAAFEGANAIARISGCSLIMARNLMKELPATLSVPMYNHQGERLVRELNKLRVEAKLIE